MSGFHLTTASVPGREHVRLSRNNQDGVCARVAGGVAVMVVTDGCGSGGSSEVGARLGAWFLAERIPALVREVGVGHELAERAADGLAQWLRTTVEPLAQGGSLAPVIAEQWLFTFLCAVMDESRALVFGVGDGVWSADGVGKVLDPGVENAPDYLAYRLVPGSLESAPKEALSAPKWAAEVGALARGRPVVHFLGAASRLAVATDGLAGQAPLLERLGDDPRVWGNPVGLQRQLNVISSKDRSLHDDTTIALMKRGA